jgi:ubiquinone/menaquinone biosynthesis C-methylase UbiE
MPVTDYLLGHSEREIQRLIRQAAILRPITERLLREIGLTQGMSVLDLGCGAGDVSMLAGEIVGPSGVVLGIDRNPDVLLIARNRSREARLEQVAFKETSLESLSDPHRFDVVIGRYVLIHQTDPTAFLRDAAARVRPGGILAFHELGYLEEWAKSCAAHPLLRQPAKWLLQAMQSGAPHNDVGRRMIEQFSMAQLPQPTLFSELLLGGGPDRTLTDLVIDTLETVLPQLVKTGTLTEAIPSVEALKDQIAADVQRTRFQVVGPAQICAFVRL